MEIPIYSMKKWNEPKGHKAPEKFVLKDKILESRIKVVNEYLRRLNEWNQIGIRSFNIDPRSQSEK